MAFDEKIFPLQVPKYLSQQWEKATGRGEVGKLRICKYVPLCIFKLSSID